MSNFNKIRVYDLARELKQDVKRIIEDLRREGADVDVPSNSVSKEIAEKIRNKYFPKVEASPKHLIKVFKKERKEFSMPDTKNSFKVTQKQKICEYCSKVIAPKHFVKRYKEHILNECPKKPIFSIKNLLKYFDLMTEKTSSINNKKFSSMDFASFLIDSELISDFNIGHSPFHHFTDEYLIATVDNGKKKLKVVIIKELLNLYYPHRIKLNSIWDVISNNSVKIKASDFDKMHKWLKKIANFYIKLRNKENLKKKTLQEIQNKENPIEIEDIDWEIFPIGDWFNNEEVTSRLFDHFRNLQNKGKGRNKFFDQSRLEGILKQLNPISYTTGKTKNEEYIVYFFDWTDKVVLECPFYGNATYVINSGKYSWQEIAKNSKFEARTEYPEQVTVINHSETWLERLEQNLRYGL